MKRAANSACTIITYSSVHAVFLLYSVLHSMLVSAFLVTQG